MGSVRSALLPTPAITPAPRCTEVDVRSLEKRQIPDVMSLAQVLLTALPVSLRLIAATNVPAVSSILWEEFLDDKKPQWFLDLPWDIQSYLIREFGPETAWPTAPPATYNWDGQVSTTATETDWWQPSESVPSSAIQLSSPSRSYPLSSTTTDASPVPSSSSGLSTAMSSHGSSTSRPSRSMTTSPASTLTRAPDTAAPAFSTTGLTRRQKIGIGIGVPFALLGVGAALFGCCFFLRCRRRRHIEGNQPPSSPGFIPRFSFQDRSLSSEHLDHRAPLNPGFNQQSQNVTTMNWEDEGYDPTGMDAPYRANTFPPAAAPMTMHNSKPIMAPALYHTHSSNRARGKRTSYSSLHAVAEVTEPDEQWAESPVLGRQSSPRHTLRRLSTPLHMEIPLVPAAATIKRKAVPTSPTGANPAAEAASQSLLRPALTKTLPDHSGSSSSGLAVSSINTSSTLGYHTDTSSPISPISSSPPRNPFAGGYDYVEDYGPEYSHNGYLDLEDGLYGGNRSLDRYPDPSPPRKNSKTDWPLRNVMGSGHKRNRSPMWDRVYER